MSTDLAQTHNGNMIFYEAVRRYTGSDGTTYTALIFDYDGNADGTIQFSEQSYFITFVPHNFDPVNLAPAMLTSVPPPPGVTLRAVRLLDNARALSISGVSFARGTVIETPDGAIPVQALRIGDKVCTADNGLQTIRWIGSGHVRQGGVILWVA